MHTLRAAPSWTWFSRTWVLWDSALVEATNDLQAVPATRRTPIQAAELRRVIRLRACVTGPAARFAYLCLAGGTMLSLVAGSLATVRHAALRPRNDL